MNAVDALVTLGPVISALDSFPVWGPVLAVVTVLLFVQAARETWGTPREDVVPEVVPPAGDTAGDTGGDTGVTCGDIDPRVSHWPGGGGGG